MNYPGDQYFQNFEFSRASTKMLDKSFCSATFRWGYLGLAAVQLLRKPQFSKVSSGQVGGAVLRVGLFVIEINQSIGEPLHVMRHIVEAKNLKRPVLWDDACRNTKAYGTKTWPCVASSNLLRWHRQRAEILSRESFSDFILAYVGVQPLAVRDIANCVRSM